MFLQAWDGRGRNEKRHTPIAKTAATGEIGLALPVNAKKAVKGGITPGTATEAMNTPAVLPRNMLDYSQETADALIHAIFTQTIARFAKMRV